MADAKIRLFLKHPLAPGQLLPLERDQAHYLFGVMRQKAGDSILVFNGREGEWRAEIAQASKRGGTVTVQEKTRPLQHPPDLWLLFAPIKKARTDFIVEKATELGVARIQPVMTQFTNSGRLNRERLQAHAIEAAEQCGGTFVPEVSEMASLDSILAEWPPDRTLVFCDEAKVNDAQSEGSAMPPPPAAILIGPEGGFSEDERTRLHALPQSVPMRLGPRVLRADTAAVSAISLWQNAVGDW